MTWAEVSALPLPRVFRLFKYWDEFPPVHILQRASIGYRSGHKGAKAPSESDVSEMTKIMGGCSDMSEEVKESIRWAEEQKLRMGKTGKA